MYETVKIYTSHHVRVKTKENRLKSQNYLTYQLNYFDKICTPLLTN